MIYFLEFLGLLGIAVILSATPLLLRVFEYIFPPRATESRPATGYGPIRARSDDNSEVRSEIRRMTALLEVDRRDARRNRPSSIEIEKP
ncbi:MAG TPA: hypothetical protein VHY75_01175 [Steroidobacteraceae bacterium]|jgi:hypothetical protein|nr:hypothetical protein [Steroidobacteraceae bacterium]